MSMRYCVYAPTLSRAQFTGLKYSLDRCSFTEDVKYTTEFLDNDIQSLDFYVSLRSGKTFDDVINEFPELKECHITKKMF